MKSIQLKKIIRTSLYIVGLLTLFYIIYNLLFHNVSYTLDKKSLLIGIFVYVVIMYVLWKIYNKLFSKYKYSTLFFFIILIILQLIIAILFVVTPSWDFGWVFNHALADIESGQSIFTSIYLNQFGNNLGITLLLKYFYLPFYLLGINHYLVLGILLNIVLIDLGLIYLYKLLTISVKKNYTNLFLFMIITFTPFICYVPIFYTDTISLPFGIMSIYYLYKFCYTEQKKKRDIILSGLLLGIGSILKVTVLIVYVAILVWIFLREKTEQKRYIVKVIVLLTVSVLVPLLSFKIYTNANLSKKMLDKYQIPTTHWIMMGLQTYGGFNGYDADYTVSFKSKQEKEEANIRKIKQRLKKHIENKELIKFYTNKLTYVWGDGTFFAPEKLRRNPKYHTKASDYIYGEKSKYYYIFAQAQWCVALCLIIIGIILRKYLTYKQRDLQLLSLITTAGILVFLLIWESRSRYLVNLLPVILISAYLGFTALMNFIVLKKNKKLNNL